MRNDSATPLTEAQLGIWLGHQRAPDSSVYNAAECVLLEGPLDVATFESALAATLQEASALHAAFPEQAGRPCRVPSPYAGSTLARVPLPGVHGDAALRGHAALLRHAREVLRRPLAIERGELFRHQLVTLSRERHAWLHVAHHIALDGYGFNLIARRVAERYGAARAGVAPAEAAFSPFEPVLDEDRAYQSSAARASDRAFWRQELGELAGASFVAQAAPELAHGLRSRQRLSVEASTRLREQAARLDLSWMDVLLAVVAARVGARTGSTAFLLGLPVMLRLGSRALKTPCMAMNIAALPVRLGEADSLLTLAGTLRASRERQRRHQRYRYEHLRVDRVAHTGKLFGPVVNIMPFDFPSRFGDCSAETLPIAAGPVEDLALSITPRGDAFELTLDGHPALFRHADLAQLSGELAADIDAWLADPASAGCAGASSRALAVVPEKQVPHDAAVVASRALAAQVQYGAPAVAPVCPLAALLRHACERPHAPALVEGAHRVSYAELERAVSACAARFCELGVTPGSLVALQLPRGTLAIVSILGSLAVGAGYVVLDPSHPAARRQAIVTQVAPRLLLCPTGEPLDLTLPTGTRLLPIAPATLRGWLHEPRDHASSALATRPECVAYVVFTSGSTGEPKGVAVGAAALAHFVGAALHSYGFEPGDRVLQFAPFSFDASVEELFVTLAAGATLVLRDDAMLESMEGFLHACERAAISVLDLPTAFFHELALAIAERSLALPPALRLLIIGGEAAQPARARAFHAAAQGVRLLNTYGPSEATVVATCAELHGEELAVTEPAPIGRPLPGVGVLLCCEGEQGAPPPGEGGELYLVGPTLATGYLGRDDLTRARFVELPGVGRAYRTGDLACVRADGQLVYRGRVDDELKISGQRVAPAEVEAALCRHPQVRSALAWGEEHAGGKRLVACVEADPHALAAHELRTFLGAALPQTMIPAQLEVHATLPRTAHGKLDRAALRSQRALSRETRETREASEVQGLLAPLEERVLAAWRSVLGVPTIGRDDDFFALGGNSLQVIQLANRLSQVGIEIRVAAIFQNPTARKQAQLLDAAAAHPATHADAPVITPSAAVFTPWSVSLPEPCFAPRACPVAGARERVLLTGASGFVGVHLLASWLERTQHTVVCTVRARDAEHARERLYAAARGAGLALEPFAARLELVSLDLTSSEARCEALVERLAACATIVHCAAEVSVVRAYESLVPANVLVTRELLGVAAHWGSAFHLVSSIATLPSHPGTLAPEALFPAHAGLADGYQRSKWHAESLCAQASAQGLAVAVHRLGRITGSRRFPTVNAQDLVWRLARAATRLGAWPDLPFEESWTPADNAGDTLVRLVLAQAAAAPARAYHLVHTGVVRLASLRDALNEQGFGLPTVPLPEWVARLRQSADDHDRSLLTFFEQQASGASASAAAHASSARDISFAQLAALVPDLDTRPVDAALLAAYCRRAVATGVLAPPLSRASAPLPTRPL